MPIIENCGMADCASGIHTNMGENSVLIQITDPTGMFPVPNNKFKEVYKFSFLDIEEDGLGNDVTGDKIDLSEFAIQDDQAKEIVDILKHAMDNDMNVLVHCQMGICRSGAVVEVASMMGFKPTNRYRQPNTLVKYKLMKQLGWTYD